MKTEAFNYGREMAGEVLRDGRTFSGVCDSCGREGALFESASDAGYCLGCLTATLAEDERKGGHLREWMWSDACRLPRESSRVYRETMRGFFATLGEFPAVAESDDSEPSPAWDACYTCGKVAPLDIHGECIACELKAGN